MKVRGGIEEVSDFEEVFSFPRVRIRRQVFSFHLRRVAEGGGGKQEDRVGAQVDWRDGDGRARAKE